MTGDQFGTPLPVIDLSHPPLPSIDQPAEPVRERFSYEEFGQGVAVLCERLAEDDWVPDAVVGITRGGLFLAAGLAYGLGIKDVRTVNVEFYSDIGATLDAPVLLRPNDDLNDLAGRRVLVADDVADSGLTLQFVRTLIPASAQVRTAVLYDKPTSSTVCDYVWRSTSEWIVFPWAATPPVFTGPVARDL